MGAPEKPRAFRPDQAPQHEDDTALILLHHANSRERDDHQNKHESAKHDQHKWTHEKPPSGFKNWRGRKPLASYTASLSDAPPSSSHRSIASESTSCRLTSGRGVLVRFSRTTGVGAGTQGMPRSRSEHAYTI